MPTETDEYRMNHVGHGKELACPAVSIIVPAYNASSYFNEAVSSALSQTYRDIEVILVDDGSTDDTPRLCDNWAARDGRTTALHKSNGGPSSARNAGIRIAGGRWLMFLDADDLLVPDAVATLLHDFGSGDCDFVCFGFQRIDGRGYPLATEYNLPAQEESDSDGFMSNLHSHMVGNFVWSRMYSKRFVEQFPDPFDEDVSFLEDIMFTNSVCRCARKIGYLPMPLYRYRTLPSSLCHRSNPSRALEGLGVLRWQLGLDEPNGSFDAKVDGVVGCLFMCYDLAGDGKSEESRSARAKIREQLLETALSAKCLSKTNKQKLLLLKSGAYEVARRAVDTAKGVRG